MEARQLDCDIRKYLEQYSNEHDLNTAFGDMIMDRYLEIIPDDAKRDMVFLGRNSVSYKPGNARLDLKSVLLAAADFVVSLNRPEDIFQYLQLVILSVLCIGSVAKKDIDYNCAVIVYALHQLNAYEIGINTEQLKIRVMDMKESYQIGYFDMESLERNINELLKWNVIYMEEEKIFLKERVWGKIKR